MTTVLAFFDNTKAMTDKIDGFVAKRLYFLLQKV